MNDIINCHRIWSVLCGVCLIGCWNSNALQISGELTFQGVPVPGEISFEPVDEKGKVVGRAISIAVPENGYFQASLPKPDREPQPYRLVVRVAPPVSRDSKSSAINASTFGSNVKTVPLSRELRSGQTLHLAITQ